MAAKTLFDSGKGIQAQKTIATHRIRPCKNSEKRLNRWYKNFRERKKQNFLSCSICATGDHIASICLLRQLLRDHEDETFLWLEYSDRQCFLENCCRRISKVGRLV